MKKDRINTSSIREIKHSFKRFLSLLVMSVLGVLVFVGLKMAAPDIGNTGFSLRSQLHEIT